MLKQALTAEQMAEAPVPADRAAPVSYVAQNAHFSTIELATGVTVHYLEQGVPTGEAMILLHGLGDSWNSYALGLPLLSNAYHVFALDQRGHGDSSKADCCYVMDDFAADVIAFLDAQGIDRATIVGHSLGSMIAQLVAIHYPERVAGLVLIGSMVAGGNETMEELQEVVHPLVDPIDPAFVREFQESTLYHPVSPDYMARVIAESLKVPAHVWRQALDSFIEQNTRDNLDKITAPTLILRGDQDSFFPHSDQETLHRLIPNATLMVYEQTGHAVHWEQPDRFVADLEQFLQQVVQ